MEILGFLFGLVCLVIIGRKRRQQKQPFQQLTPKPPESKEREISHPTTSLLLIPRRDVPKQLPISTKARLSTRKHQYYIQLANLVLHRLRGSSTEVSLPKAIAILRKMNPYAFEELLLTCCQEQGWKIQRNFRYSNDGGIDGRVIIAGKLYLIQAKRYRGYINPQHIRKFRQFIQGEEAAGGFLIHTGKTGDRSKELLREYRVSLISGQRLVNFVLGQRLKIVG